MRTYTKVALLMLALLAAGRTTAAAQVLSCDAEAFKNRDVSQMSYEYRAAYLKSIDRTKFQQIKSQSEGGGGFSIAGISLGGSASYEDFHELREQELTRMGYEIGIEQSEHYVRNSFDGPGARAYHACVASLVALQRGRGLFMWIVEPTDSSITVKIHWRPSPGSMARIDVSRDVQLRGSSASLRNFPTRWRADMEYQIALDRSIGTDLRFVVNLGGDTAAILIPRKPEVARPPCVARRLSADATEYFNVNRAVRVHDAYVAIESDCRAMLYFKATSTAAHRLLERGAPGILFSLKGTNGPLTEFSGLGRNVTVSACGQAESHTIALNTTHVGQPATLNRATGFSLKLPSGANGTACQ